MKTIDGIFKNYKYKNEQHRSLVGILFVAANIHSHLEKILKPYKITLPQYRLMRQLRVIYPGFIPIYELKEYLIDNNPDVSRLVTRILRMGWIEKRSSKVDKRVIHIKITQKGIDLMNVIDKHEDEFLAPVSVLDDDTSRQLNAHLEKVLCSFQLKPGGKISSPDSPILSVEDSVLEILPN